MIPQAAYTIDWINTQRRSLGGCDPQILEKSVHALALLGHLADSNLPFLFKGGTSILLHVEPVRRLSIDIDIVCTALPAEMERIVAQIGRTPPFLRSEEDHRGERGLPRRRHFKFYFRSALDPRPEAYILLDVVSERRTVLQVVQKPIRTHFIHPDREVHVTVPTVDSLLSDKLTAFAPATIGVPVRRRDGSPGDVMQVAKQLFDIGVLFEYATDFRQIAAVYAGAQAMESEYRGGVHTADDSLGDTIRACLALSATKPKVLVDFPDASLLHDGFRRLRSHLVGTAFTERDVRRFAARAAFVAIHILKSQPLDFGASRYTGIPEQLAVLTTASLNGSEHPWLDGLKATNPEAYHYWFHAAR